MQGGKEGRPGPVRVGKKDCCSSLDLTDSINRKSLDLSFVYCLYYVNTFFGRYFCFYFIIKFRNLTRRAAASLARGMLRAQPTPGARPPPPPDARTGNIGAAPSFSPSRGGEAVRTVGEEGEGTGKGMRRGQRGVPGSAPRGICHLLSSGTWPDPAPLPHCRSANASSVPVGVVLGTGMRHSFLSLSLGCCFFLGCPRFCVVLSQGPSYSAG